MVAITEYERDLARIDAELARLVNIPTLQLTEGERARRLAFGRYQRAALTGDLRELMEIEPLIDAAMERVGPWPDLYLLKANLHFKLHRLAEVRRNLSLATDIADSPEVRALEADLLVQEGRYQEARAVYRALLADVRSWDVLARLAYLEGTTGDIEGADRLYLEAEDKLTAKEMRAYAWVEMQRGSLDVSRGRYVEGGAHYERADMAYSGYWEIGQRIAVLRAAEGRLDEAIALCLTLIERHPRPELQQALGSLYARRGQAGEAERWHGLALAAYRQSAERGEVHYLHHLAEFYTDERPDRAEAVRWASEDLRLRPGPFTRAALAWALYRDGQLEAALELMRQALASDVRDAGLLVRAGTIYRAAGRDDEGHEYLHLAAGTSPDAGHVHVHH